jgi:MFS family permease
MTSNTGLWTNPGFRRLWIGQAISEAGSRITRDGLPMAAVMVLGATPFQMGILTALGGAATLLFGMIAGVWVDRLRRRPVLIVADLGRAAVIGSIPLAAHFGVLAMPQIYAVAALAGVLTVLFDVAYQAYVPTLVDRAHLVEANSRLALTGSIAEVLGPGLTGVLVRVLTAPVAMLIDALSFLASAISVALIRNPESEPVSSATPHLIEEIRDGWRAVMQHPVLRVLAFRAATLGLFHGLVSPLYVLYAMRDLGLGPLSLGIVIAIGGVSNLTGALLAPRVARRFGLGTTLFWSAVLYSVGLMLIPVAHPPLAFAIACLAGQQLLGDGFYMISVVNETALRQSITPDRLLGRVSAVMQLLTRGIWPIGALISGALAEVIGARNTLWIAACGILASAAWLLAPAIQSLKTHK